MDRELSDLKTGASCSCKEKFGFDIYTLFYMHMHSSW